MAKAEATYREKYLKEVAPKVASGLGIKNSQAVPVIERITISAGIGKLMGGSKDASMYVEGLTAITGQKPVINKARKSVSNFKLREGMIVGVTVTLRGDKMWDFLEKLLNVVIPRIRDFRGLSPKSFDGSGNYCLGLREQTVFPEAPVDEGNRTYGLQINIGTTAKNNEEGMTLLTEFGFPFKKPVTTENNNG